MKDELRKIFIESGLYLNDDNDDMLLLNLIPYLKHFPYNEGGEGRAYFIFDKLVVKEFINFNDENMFSSLFESYCKEMQNFAKKGYSVPKIYSWVKVPSVVTRKGQMKFGYKYYILEEQVKGREVFVGYLQDAYHICRDLCSEEKFDKLMFNPELDKGLYKEIIKAYINDYMTMNMNIEAMSEKDIERFVMTIHSMYEQGKYSIPDMYPSNMIYNGKTIFMIDNNLTDRATDNVYLSKTADEFTLIGLMYTFLYNEQVSGLNMAPYFLFEDKSLNLDGLMKKNSLLCDAAIKKLLKVSKKCIKNPFVKDKKVIERLYQMLKNILGKDKAKNIIEISKING